MWFKAEIAWVKSFESAMAMAKASKKLVMVDFYTDWSNSQRR